MKPIDLRPKWSKPDRHAAERKRLQRHAARKRAATPAGAYARLFYEITVAARDWVSED